MVTAPPTAVPPVEQSGAEEAGPHTKKLTVPVTAPRDPLSVAVSVAEPPGEIWEGLACVVMVAGVMTASALRDRSWFPTLPAGGSSSSRRWWYGDPEMLTAEFPAP